MRSGEEAEAARRRPAASEASEARVAKGRRRRPSQGTGLDRAAPLPKACFHVCSSALASRVAPAAGCCPLPRRERSARDCLSAATSSSLSNLEFGRVTASAPLEPERPRPGVRRRAAARAPGMVGCGRTFNQRWRARRRRRERHRRRHAARPQRPSPPAGRRAAAGCPRPAFRVVGGQRVQREAR